MAEMASSMPYVFTLDSPITANHNVEQAPVFTISLQKWLLRSMHHWQAGLLVAFSSTIPYAVRLMTA
jgi:hypothetical protein